MPPLPGGSASSPSSGSLEHRCSGEGQTGTGAMSSEIWGVGEGCAAGSAALGSDCAVVTLHRLS